MLCAEALFSLAAIVKMLFNLPSLVRVKVLEVIDSVSPHGVGVVSTVNFESPLSRINNLIECLNNIDFLNSVLTGALFILHLDHELLPQAVIFFDPEQYFDHLVVDVELSDQVFLKGSYELLDLNSGYLNSFLRTDQ